MNMKKYTLYLLLLMLLPVFGACKALKDGYGIDHPEQYSRVYLAAAFGGMQKLELDAPKPVEIRVFTNYSGVVPLASDLQVSLAVDLSKVAQYNRDNGTAFKFLPQNCFRFTDNVSVIPAGQSRASEPVIVTILTTEFLDDGTYLLPIRITGVSDPAFSINHELETLFLGISCKASALSVTSSPLDDYTMSGTESWNQ